MKKIALISMAVSLGIASLPANAAKPDPASSYIGVSCTCDWSTDPGTCTVSWSASSARDYGVSIKFDAASDVSSSASLNLNDDWACYAGMCSASGEFALPDYPNDAAVTFKGLVKAFPDGGTPRMVAKGAGACNLPDDEDDEPVFDPNMY